MSAGVVSPCSTAAAATTRRPVSGSPIASPGVPTTCLADLRRGQFDDMSLPVPVHGHNEIRPGRPPALGDPRHRTGHRLRTAQIGDHLGPAIPVHPGPPLGVNGQPHTAAPAPDQFPGPVITRPPAIRNRGGSRHRTAGHRRAVRPRRDDRRVADGHRSGERPRRIRARCPAQRPEIHRNRFDDDLGLPPGQPPQLLGDHHRLQPALRLGGGVGEITAARAADTRDRAQGRYPVRRRLQDLERLGAAEGAATVLGHPDPYQFPGQTVPDEQHPPLVPGHAEAAVPGWAEAYLQFGSAPISHARPRIHAGSRPVH